jgi:hypothetical protein
MNILFVTQGFYSDTVAVSHHLTYCIFSKHDYCHFKTSLLNLILTQN